QYVLRRAAAFQKLVEQGIGLLLGNGHWFSSFSLVADNQLHSYLYTLAECAAIILPTFTPQDSCCKAPPQSE
ncbi:hypothetical protein, partial [Halothiobacillus sp.]|uniref:hypothetical protein n=1 Tax=Halothiobacillus sp. TaxID=1891311 RepID=UPI002619EE29